MPPSGSGVGAVLTMLDVLDRDFQEPILETKNGLVIDHRLDPDRAWIAANLRRIVVDPAIGHPRLRLNSAEPVRKRRNASLAVFAHVLLADPADRDDPACAVGQAAPKQPLCLEDPERVVPLCSVGENREVLFG